MLIIFIVRIYRRISKTADGEDEIDIFVEPACGRYYASRSRVGQVEHYRFAVHVVQEFGEIARVERYRNIRAVGLDGQIFLDRAYVAVRAHRHIGLGDVEPNEVIVLFRARHEHRAVDSVLEHRFGDIYLRVEMLRDYLAVVDELAVDEPRRDGRRVDAYHQIVFVEVELDLAVVVGHEPRNLHDGARGHDYAGRSGGRDYRLDALGEAVAVERDGGNAVLGYFEQYALERRVSVVGAYRESHFVDEIAELRVFHLEVLGIFYLIDNGVLVDGVAAEFALAAVVVYFEPLAAGAEHYIMRSQLFDELAEKLARHDDLARLDDARAYHVFYRQLEIGRGQGERSVLGGHAYALEHGIGRPRRNRFYYSRDRVAEVVTVTFDFHLFSPVISFA